MKLSENRFCAVMTFDILVRLQFQSPPTMTRWSIHVGLIWTNQPRCYWHSRSQPDVLHMYQCPGWVLGLDSGVLTVSTLKNKEENAYLQVIVPPQHVATDASSTVGHTQTKAYTSILTFSKLFISADMNISVNGPDVINTIYILSNDWQTPRA